MFIMIMDCFWAGQTKRNETKRIESKRNETRSGRRDESLAPHWNAARESHRTTSSPLLLLLQLLLAKLASGKAVSLERRASERAGEIGPQSAASC